MSKQAENWIKEGSSTLGAGDLILTGNDVGFTRFRDALLAGEVYYSIEDGTNREAGIGLFNGSNTIARTQVQSTLKIGVFNKSNPTPLSLSGLAIVSGSINAEAYKAIQSDIAAGTDNIEANAVNILANTAAIVVNSNTISTNTSNIQQNDVEIAANTTSIIVLESSVGQNDTDIANNTADIANNSINIDTLNSEVSQNTTDISGNTDAIGILDIDVSFRESAVTALETGGAITGAGTTSILVAAGNGEIVNSYSDPEAQITKEVSWAETTFDLLANAGMPVASGLGFTGIGVAKTTSGDGQGVITAYPNGTSDAQRRSVIILGFVEYVDRVITAVKFAPIVSNQIGNTVLDIISFMPTTSRLKGLLTRPTAIGDMTVWRDIGSLFGSGVNYENALDNQNVLAVPADGSTTEGVNFYPLQYNDGTTITDTVTNQVPVDVYEPDGSGVSTITNNNAVIHYLLQSLSGVFVLSYGQQEYDNYETAKSNLFADQASHLFPAETTKFIILAQMVVLKGTTTWGLTAEIFPLGSAVSSSSSGGEATSAINISYTDIYSLGTNVQAAIDSLAAIKLTPDQKASLDAANAPSAANALATVGDIPLVSGVNTGDEVFYYTELAAFPVTGNAGYLYGAEDTNLLYRWSVDQYVAVGTPDTIVEEGDNVSLLTNDANYATNDTMVGLAIVFGS